MVITFVGHGYVGLVTACVFADLGNTVYVIGRNKDKLKRLESGDPIIFEPGLAELLQRNIKAKRIFFTDSYSASIPKSSVVFIAVGTPPKQNGDADLSNVFSVAKKIGENLDKNYTVIACKSTVPPGVNRKIAEIIEKAKKDFAQFDIASCPEFLREGSALQDTFSPDRLVIGADSQKGVEELLKLHEPLPGKRVIVSIESAEIIKYASNSVLATKISFANLISFYCEKTGADVEEVLDGVGLDKRIGREFFYSGVGYGGSCFPKDVKALIKTGKSLDIDTSLLEAVESINQHAQINFLNKILTNTKGKKLGIWGLAFKPNTDDIRFAPSIFVIEKLLNKKFEIKVYDPQAINNTQKILGDKVQYCKNPYEAASDVDALVIFTEWNEFKQIDLKKIKNLMIRPLIIDGRNIYDIGEIKKLGFEYISSGRKA